MTSNEFVEALIAAFDPDDMSKAAKVMQQQTDYYVKRMAVTEYESLEMPCILAAVMILDKAYRVDMTDDAIELVQQIADSAQIMTIKVPKAGDRNV